MMTQSYFIFALLFDLIFSLFLCEGTILINYSYSYYKYIVAVNPMQVKYVRTYNSVMGCFEFVICHNTGFAPLRTLN